MASLPPPEEGREKFAGTDMPDGSSLTSPGKKRSIPKGHEYDSKAIKPLAKMLWAMSVSMGHALTAYRQFTKLKSSTISPDGMLGGRGYVMDVKEVRQKLYDACEALSAISDTIHDEINAPHWQSKLEQLTRGEKKDVRRYVDKAEEVMDEAEDVADGDEEEMPEDSTDDPTTPEDESKDWSAEDDDDEEDTSSELPDGGDPETLDGYHKHKPNRKTASFRPLFDDTFGVIANSSLPVETLPGPRVEHLDRGDAPGPYGSWNRGEEPSDDNYDGHPDRHQKGMSEVLAGSGLPGALTDKTETNADDFGLGGGENPRSGEGLEHGPASDAPGGKGVWGPHSGLPEAPDGKPGPESGRGDAEELEVSLRDRNVFQAGLRGATKYMAFLDDASSFLPNDQDDAVARSDYYPGEKGNIVSESELPGEDLTVPSNPDPPETMETSPDVAAPYGKIDEIRTAMDRRIYQYGRTTRTKHNG